MLRRLTRKLFTLVVLCAALAIASSAPVARTNVICMDAPVEWGCPSNYFCCREYTSECWCGS